MPNVSPVDDFESFLPQRLNTHVDTPFAALKEENDIPITLYVSPTELSTPRDITKDVLVFPNPPNPLTHSCKFEGSERLKADANYKEHDPFSDLEECIVEEIPLGESCGMLVYEVSLLVLSLSSICPLTPLT